MTAEQLTNLLRSTQHHSAAVSATTSVGVSRTSGTNHFAPGMIRGGGGSMRVGKNEGSMFITSSSLPMQQLMQSGNSASRYDPNVRRSSAIRSAGGVDGGTTASVASAITSPRSNVDIDEMLLNDDHASIASSSSTDFQDTPPSVQTISTATTQATNNTKDHNGSSGALTRPPSHVGSTNRAFGNISSATTSSTKRQSIEEMY